MRLFYEQMDSPIGPIYITFQGPLLAGVSFKKPSQIGAGNIPEVFKRQMVEYLEGNRREFNQEVALLHGTEFEHSVWLALKEIPYGETRSYKWLAERLRRPGGSRAVGQALSKNPIPIVLPCHRVIESDGSIGGYSSGTEIKRRLLDLEYYHSLAGSRDNA